MKDVDMDDSDDHDWRYSKIDQKSKKEDVLKSEAERDNVQIWRYDCCETIQGYNSHQSQPCYYLHKSANVFSGFILTDLDNIISIVVKYMQAVSTSYALNIMKS